MGFYAYYLREVFYHTCEWALLVEMGWITHTVNTVGGRRVARMLKQQ